MPTTGLSKSRYPNSSATPDVPADLLNLAQDVDRNTVGVADATERAALVTKGFAFEGMRVFQRDTKVEYLYTSSNWIPAPLPVRRQLNTTNDITHLAMQVGIGFVTGTVATSATKAVTFPVAFAASTNPHIQVSFAGSKTSGAFDPTGTGGATAGVEFAAPTNTGFTMVLRAYSGNLTTVDYYY